MLRRFMKFQTCCAVDECRILLEKIGGQMNKSKGKSVDDLINNVNPTDDFSFLNLHGNSISF